jgi:hypothetical protein
MAKATLNPILEQLRGQVGDLVFKQYGDKIVVTKKPDLSKHKPTAAQRAQRERFRQATLYGKGMLADPAVRAVYDEAAKARGKPVLSLMVADFLNAPSVDEVDVSGYGRQGGDEIVVAASDDFGVVGVNLALTDGSGHLIEEGAAIESPPKSDRWVYTATAAVAADTTVCIAVTATDRPGNVAEVKRVV